MIIDLPPNHPLVEMSRVIRNEIKREFPHVRMPAVVESIATGDSTNPRDFQLAGSPGPMVFAAMVRWERGQPARVIYSENYIAQFMNAERYYRLKRKMPSRVFDYFKIMVHENLHLVQGDVSNDSSIRQANEASTEAVAQDIVTTMAGRMTRKKYVQYSRAWVAYPTCVSSLRAISARATGSPSWRKVPARAWRYQFHFANGATKAQMLRAQGVNPGELC